MALLKQLLNGSLSALLNEQREFFVLRPGWAYRREAPSAIFVTNYVSSSPRVSVMIVSCVFTSAMLFCHPTMRWGSDIFFFRLPRADAAGLLYTAHMRGLKYPLADARMQKAGSEEPAK